MSDRDDKFFYLMRKYENEDVKKKNSLSCFEYDGNYDPGGKNALAYVWKADVTKEFSQKKDMRGLTAFVLKYTEKDDYRVNNFALQVEGREDGKRVNKVWKFNDFFTAEQGVSFVKQFEQAEKAVYKHEYKNEKESVVKVKVGAHR